MKKILILLVMFVVTIGLAGCEESGDRETYDTCYVETADGVTSIYTDVTINYKSNSSMLILLKTKDKDITIPRESGYKWRCENDN